ncbi:MAG: hypothetical protein JNN04_17585 [Cyclobacteriaceae bacterium]|nr:hypothetical protein [Cyclobacteriaceae bacterium]
MKRLDEIPKKLLFEAPEGYFEKLPGRIQARISQPEPEVAWGKMALRYALPVLVLGAAAVFFLTSRPALSPEELIASIDSEQLVAYLEDSEVNTDDLLDAIALEPTEVESIELDAMGDFVIDEATVEEWVEDIDDSVR